MSKSLTDIKSALEAKAQDAGYSAQPIIDDLFDELAEREYQITEFILDAAQDLGQRGPAIEILDKSGISFRPVPEPEPEVVAAPGPEMQGEPVAATLAEIMQEVRKMQDTVGRLVAAASRAGITV